MALFKIAVFGQSVQDILKKSTHYFILDERDSLTGDGATFIQKKIVESQFF